MMPVPQLTHAQSRRRIAALSRAGCDVAVITYESGDKTVIKRCPPMLENPPPAPNAAGYLILAGFAAAALYAIFRPKKAAAAAPEVTPPVLCSLETTEDFARLEAWSSSKNLGVVYLPATAKPPLPAESELAQSFVRSGATIIVVTNDGRFWTYDTGQPVETTVYRQDFCNFKPTATVSGIRWLS